jgi:hypothetical protein
VLFRSYSVRQPQAGEGHRCVLKIINRQNLYPNYRNDDYFLQKMLQTELIITQPEELAGRQASYGGWQHASYAAGEARNPRRTIPFAIACAPDADWGRKTVVFDLVTSGKHSRLWRPLQVLRRPEPGISAQVIDQAHPRLTVTNAEHPLTASGPMQRVRLSIEGKATALDSLASGASASCEVASPAPGAEPALVTRLAELSWLTGDQRQ